MLEGFEELRLDVGEVEVAGRRGGSGPPVLLLHGWPQTHVMWHLVAPLLAERLTVVMTDLRGYGDSSKPTGDEQHAVYSKRAMAADQVEVMARLGFERFAVVGHDRGARVAHRMALDHPQRVSRLAVLDIVPTRHVFATADADLARSYYHWFFLIQPGGLPERLIGADPSFYLRHVLGALGPGIEAFAPDAVAEYERCYSDPAAIHASCEDYRAAATIDLEHDEADAGRTIEAPLLALWGANGKVGQREAVLEVWRERAADVRGRALECGHFLPEELPEETAGELLTFLGEGTTGNVPPG
ncbi:MAG: alpha/beta fold hydrolase [Thermoleophilaceae bacterium]